MNLVDNSKTQFKRFGRSQVEIGRFTYGYDQMKVVQFREGAKLTFGSFCSIAVELTVMLGGNHRVDWATTFPFGHIFQDQLGGGGIKGHPISKGDVMIGHDVWVGRGSTIMSGITIGDGAVIAANSTVVKDVGDYEIWGGNPAKFIKKRFDVSVIAKLLELKWWECEIEVIKEISPLISQAPTLQLLKEVEELIEAGK